MGKHDDTEPFEIPRNRAAWKLGLTIGVTLWLAVMVISVPLVAGKLSKVTLQAVKTRTMYATKQMPPTTATATVRATRTVRGPITRVTIPGAVRTITATRTITVPAPVRTRTIRSTATVTATVRTRIPAPTVTITETEIMVDVNGN